MSNIVVPQPGQAPAKADVVIIGAGIVGVATAFFAARAGLHAVVVERCEQPGMLATAVSSECVREQWNQPHNIAMMRESLSLIEGFAELVGIPGLDISLHQQGYLFLTATAERAEQNEKLVALQHRHGLPNVELLDGNEIRRRFPWIGPGVVNGRFDQRDGWLAVHEMVWGFIKGSECDLLLKTAVTGIERDRRGVCGVATSSGRIRTRRVVVAAGPFSGQVAALGGVDLPLFNVRRQEVRLARQGVCPPGAPMTVDDDSGVYWRPDGPAALLGGGDGKEAPAPPSEHVPCDWDFPAVVLEKAMVRTPFWSAVAETLKAEEVFVSAGQYSYVVDRCPVIGPTPVRGLYLNAAYDGHGIMGAPAGSRLLVDLMTGKVKPADNPFALSRLESGRPLDVEDAIL